MYLNLYIIYIKYIAYMYTSHICIVYIVYIGRLKIVTEDRKSTSNC